MEYLTFLRFPSLIIIDISENSDNDNKITRQHKHIKIIV
jgi:hypothetical protein